MERTGQSHQSELGSSIRWNDMLWVQSCQRRSVDNDSITSLFLKVLDTDANALNHGEDFNVNDFLSDPSVVFPQRGTLLTMMSTPPKWATSAVYMAAC